MIVLVLTAALVVPYFIDWTNYRADFEREASRILGRDVEVRGAATARLLPFPSVSFTDVLVTDQGGATIMTIDTFSMDAELMPFLSGEVLIFDMRLERPQAVITVGEDGVPDLAVRPSAPIDVRHVRVENLTVTDGAITIRHRAGEREHVLSDINAELSARTLAGPWRASGDMRIDGVATAMTVATGTAEPGGLRLRLRAEPRDYPLTLESEGMVTIGEAGGIAYRGQFSLGVHALVHADASVRGPPDYRVSGLFELDHERLASEDFRFETGPLEDPYIADGSALIAIGEAPRFEIVAEGVQLLMDDAAGGAASLEERIAALHGFVTRLPKPTIPGTIQLDLPAVVAGDTTIREVRVRAEPSEAGWRIATLNAALPGRTSLEASGELTVGEELGFAGSLLLAVNQPSGFAAWLSRDVDEAIRRLPAAGFSAEVELGERQQRFRDLELVLGSSVFRGEIDNRQPEDARPSMTLRLEGEGLDVDGMNAFASLFVTGRGQNRLADHDLDFQIQAERVRMAGIDAGHVDTAFQLHDGQLEIERLDIRDLAGADIGASGRLRDFGADMPKGEIDASVRAADLEPLLRLLAGRLPENRLLAELTRRAQAHPGLMADADFSILANAAAGSDGSTDLTLNAGGRAGGIELTMSLSSRDWSGDLAASPVSARLHGRGEEAADLYGLVGLPGELRGFAGPARLDLVVDGVLGMGAATRLTLTGDDARARFEGDMWLTGETFTAKGTGRVQGEDLMPWLLTAAVPLPGLDTSLPTDLRADIDYSGGLLVLSALEGEMAQTRLSGELNASIRDGLPHLTGEFFLQALDVSLLTEMLFGAEAHVANGALWPTAPFQSGARVPFTADLALTIDRARLAGGVGIENLTTRARLGSDGLSVSDLSAEAFGGQLSGLGELRNDGGEGLFSAQLRLDDADLAMLAAPTALEGSARLTATLSSTGKSFDAMFSALAGSGTAELSSLVVPGVAADALPGLLTAADGIGREIDEEKTARFAPAIARAGRFDAGDVEFAFSIAGGILRAPPIQLTGQGARMTAELNLDVGRLQAEAQATVLYEAGADALVGSDPSVRFVARGAPGDLSVGVDTEPLARFLIQRALEREQQRVEDMQARLIEQQRLRRETRYFAALRQERHDREEARRLAEEQAQRMIEEEMRRRVEAEERRVQEAERLRIEEEERRRLDEEQRRRAQEEAEIRLRQDRQRVEDARERADEAARVEEQRRLRLEDEIEGILRQEQAPEGDQGAILRAPLEAPAGAVAGASPAASGRGPEAGAPTTSESSLPGVWGGTFRPESLTPEGLAGSR